MSLSLSLSFSLSIVDLQYSVSFLCTEKCFRVFFFYLFILSWSIADYNAVTVSGRQQKGSATHTRLDSPPNSPPVQAATEH